MHRHGPHHPASQWVAVICAAVFASLAFLASPLAAQQVDPGKDPGEPQGRQADPFDRALEASALVPWCIVPFDAGKRSPAERAAMLQELGMTRCAYDWRQEHVATFEQEILEYQRRDIEFFAFWGEHEAAFTLFEKYDLHPQIWRMMPSPQGDQDAKVEAAAAGLKPLAKRTRRLGCKLGIYNHGGWNGEPRNMVAVCRRLREQGFPHVGIVYNFHHGHEHIEGWAEHWKLMRPYVLCLNLNGMNPNAAPKILGLGQGRHELQMLQVVKRSGYAGPFGILDHRPELDAKKSLQENLTGLQWLRAELKAPGSGGAKPTPPARPPRKDAAAPPFSHSRVVEGQPAYRRFPLTVSCRANLTSKSNYNILVANETKQSPSHWELFTVRGNGHLALYLPGCRPDHVHSGVDICDGRPHLLKCVCEPQRIQLFIDNKRVADEKIQRIRKGESAGGLGLGRLVEGGLGCSGRLHWVHLQSQADDSALANDAEKSAATIELWQFPRAPASAATLGSHGAHSAGAGADASAEAPQRIVPYDPQLVATALRQARLRGDALRGAQVFATAKFACISCHRVLRQGGVVGPPLEKVVPRRKPAELVESILWPRRKVDPQYELWQLLNEDGEQRKGYRLPSAEHEVKLKDPATGAVSTTSRDDVAGLKAAGTLMPDGLAAAMTTQQRADLIAFVLSAGGWDQPLESQVAAALEHAQQHHPMDFPYQRQPLHPEHWPHAAHPVNRDRTYDFYAKQAEHFGAMPTPPMLVSAFPGLDGGQQGHWGNQNEQTWADNRWNDVRLGAVQAGVFRGAGKTVARGVCVRVHAAPAAKADDDPRRDDADNDPLSACFDPDTLTYAAVWRDGFVKFSSVRHGFMHGLQMDGEPLAVEPASLGARPEAPFQYLGFHRFGKRVAFVYRIGDVEYLDAPMMVDGKFHREVAPRARHSWTAMAGDAAPQWPQRLTRPVRRGEAPEGWPYAVDTFELPTENPWNALLFCGGHDFLSNGDVIVATMHGDVWRVSDEGATATWRRVASGLHQPQGVVVHKDEIYVQGRDQLTRLHDQNGDGEADFYECFSNAFDTSPAGHDFICGLQRDQQGRFYTVSGNQGLLRISADGDEVEVLATGFRNPDGLALTPDGTVTVPCSEGGWTPASQICETPAGGAAAEPPPYFGFGGPRGARPELPLVYLPRGLDNSSGGQVTVDSRRWGPLEGQMLHLSFGAGRSFLLLRDEVDGVRQGAVMPLPGEFLSGAHRGRFHPKDGQLYVSGMAGWGSYTPDDGCLQRVRHTGGRVQAPLRHHVHRNGVLIEFSQPLDKSVAGAARSHFVQGWNYRYSGAYGSPEFSLSHPGVIGHDPLAVTQAHVLPDGKSLFLEIPELQPCSQLHLHLRIATDRVVDLFATVHRMDDEFRQLPDYLPLSKRLEAHPMDRDLALAAKRQPNPWRVAVPGSREVTIETGKNLTYATRRITARPGEKLALVLVNPDVVPHNWALVKPGALVDVGRMANRLVADPEAYARHYIPRSDLVLAYTDVVGPGQEFRIYFSAPSKPGRYPYLCTFPGHWMVMNGELVVR